MFNTALSRFRLLSHLEGLSFLILLGIAMPLKYMAGIPEVVSVVGMIHGVLFILYVVAVFYMAKINRWKIIRTIGALIASVFPFGNFILDARLRQDNNKLKDITIPK